MMVYGLALHITRPLHADLQHTSPLLHMTRPKPAKSLPAQHTPFVLHM